MAHPRVIAQRQAIAYQRLLDAAGRLSTQFNVAAQVDHLRGATNRDPAMQQMLQSEALADLLETLANQEAPSTTMGLRAAVAAASDEDLVSIPGIGDKSLGQIRTWAAEMPEPEVPAEEPAEAPAEETATELPPVTVETVEEKPLETVETVEVVPAEDTPVADEVAEEPAQPRGRKRNT